MRSYTTNRVYLGGAGGGGGGGEGGEGGRGVGR